MNRVFMAAMQGPANTSVLPEYLDHPPSGASPLEPSVRGLARMLYQHDAKTLAHSWRVAGLCIFLYARLLPAALRKVPLHDLHSAALLHDIGKLSVPHQLLQAPRALEPEEMTLMRRHAANGGRLLCKLRGPLRALACTIAITHHERWNGNGYPVGTASRNRPLHCQVAALMDVFDALASPRAYKPGWSLKQLTEFFMAQSGGQFAPDLIARLAPHWTSLLVEHQRLYAMTISDDESKPSTDKLICQ